MSSRPCSMNAERLVVARPGAGRSPGLARKSRPAGPGRPRGGRSSCPPRARLGWVPWSGQRPSTRSPRCSRPRRPGSRGRRRCSCRCRRRRSSAATNSCTNASCSGSVVRMKKSLLASTAAATSLNLGTISSTCCLGVSPRAAAACSTLVPCSSVPVRKKTSSPAGGGPGQDVGGDRGVGVADVGHVVDVVDRGGDVEAHEASLASALPEALAGGAVGTRWARRGTSTRPRRRRSG